MKSIDKTNYDILLFHLFHWFEENKRSLPWREYYHPYEVWISEMMLQQTQMDRGVEYFLRWMAKFSSIKDVARASESEILQAWEGLGYYSRAKNLHKAAKIICEKHDCEIPSNYDALLALPGIGSYTAAAIMGIAFEKDYATIDANVERVFSRLCNITDNNLKVSVSEEVNKILPHGKARIFNQALMEFGALLCKKVPQCEKCPLIGLCEAFLKKVQNERPLPKKKAEIVPVYATFCILKNKEKGYLVRKRPKKGLWADMWEFIGLDTFIVDKSSEGSNLTFLSTQNNMESFARYLLIDALKKIFTKENLKNLSGNFLNNKSIIIKHSYTNHRLQAYFFYKEITFDIVAIQDYRWIKSLDEVAMPAHHRKALNKALGSS